MRRQTQERGADELVTEYVEAVNEFESSRLLEKLVADHALPLIREIIRSNLPVGELVQDTEDIVNEVALQLFKRLRNFKSNPNGQILSSFRGYVAVSSYNACYKRMRRLYPERSRLKDKLKYILTHQEGLAIWQDKNRKWL